MIRKYPDQFYEPIRIEIATSQIKHDLRKLLPSIGENEWEKIDEDIESWFSGDRYELEPVHDFWNFFGGFARGLKLKSLLYWITADNIEWTKRDVPIENIIITWDFPGLEFLGKAPYRAVEAIKILSRPSMQNRKKEMLEDSQFHSARYFPRDYFPIILFYDQKGGIISRHRGYYILEGNRRTVRAILRNQETILAYVGKFKSTADLWPKNYWLRTGLLRDLVFMAIFYEKERDDRAFRVIRNFYQLLLRDFEIARIATFDKTFKTFETSERLLRDLIMEDLK